MRSALVLIVAAACVSSSTHKKTLAELDAMRKDRDLAAEHVKALDGELAKQKQGVLDLQSRLADTQAQLDAATTERANLQRQLDDSTQLVATMRQRLEKLGQNIDALTKQKGQLDKAMTDANARLEELRKQAAAAEARAATFRNLITKLRAMIDSGQLTVVIRDGRMIIALPNDILFDSAKTTVKPEGKAALAKVAQVLATMPDRNFLVAGHTDDLPIRTELFPSNWELSTRRAVEVVHYLVSQGMRAKVLAAAGYGEFDPIAQNDSPEHRAKNRRIEIVLQPNLSDLPSLDELTSPKR
jgi:chemotaxis protein MotB